MSDLTKEQIHQLREATKLLFAASLKLGKEIPDMLKRAAKGRDEVAEILRQRAATAAEAELRGMLEATRDNHAKIFDRILDVARSAGSLPTQIQAAASKAKADAEHDVTLKNVDPAVALANARASLQFDPILKEFAIAFALFPEVNAIEAYTDMSEAFLQRKAGSVDVGGRVEHVLRTFLKDVVGIALPPFFDTVRDVIRQSTESQIKRDIAELNAESGERLYRLRRVQDSVTSYAKFANDMTEHSRKAGIEAAENEQKALAQAKAVVDGHESPSSPQ